MEEEIQRALALPHSQRRALARFLAHAVTDHKRDLMAAVVEQRTRYITVVLEEIYQPHNASACIRSCDCFGVQDVHIIEGVNPYRVNREIALGAARWLSLHKYGQPGHANTAEAVAAVRKAGYAIAATTLREGSIPLAEVPLDRKVALLFGSEEGGLSETAHTLADYHVHIPMVGFTQSFNISVSVALSLYELTGRLRRSDLPWQLSAEEREELQLSWLITTATRGDALVRHFIKEQRRGAQAG